MAFLSKDDAINAREGVITATIDGKDKEIAEVKSLTASVELTKADFKALGTSVTQKKTTGWSGTGTMTIYYVTSDWNKIILDYTKYKKVTNFDIIVTNEDKSTSIGKQTVKLSKCTLDGGDIAKMDADSDFLDGSYNFTFEDWDIMDTFDPYTTLS